MRYEVLTDGGNPLGFSLVAMEHLLGLGMGLDVNHNNSNQGVDVSTVPTYRGYWLLSWARNPM
jgi:hypothetical protein